MNTPAPKEYPLLPETASHVFQFLRTEAEKNVRVPLPNLYGLSDRELAEALIREASHATLLNPTLITQDSYEDRLYSVFTAVRARLAGKKPPLQEGDEVVLEQWQGDIRELEEGQTYFVQRILFRYMEISSAEPDWEVNVSLDEAGEQAPGGGFANYDARLFKKVTQKAAA
ncbi:hypothetical protein A3C20_03880 [Candidatus Kaiserbacteria bacterium RIFCSPHIGHO2_02_FULL_55_25]|uniref:Uncharacterized protein n=1 Tax=Candidatus Kaiserbacteria bacterium RIFCSPHIGHO2_02_FULL_55_25 TaxID=1798498 RepID=A0A1F6E7E8_9BACT|nr:MAG: hypothetical protein A3C20_03880 [Candidatus Kaiserbacteria bacterium RIFCSPHIGHO2_02_FULL_55_25]OGG77402.1 MAG: hypothetical protein A3F56_01325 [Candidatus Kaiserbacteria bacterium RIFCSPHIGHO2_12_FULL_55_13]OGG83292.1 MAG: hypothetical protein A3A42_01795 [Candidatus Kaiserbacteria bacterium RIFCSPLOWO2_01_FULL_55_25]